MKFQSNKDVFYIIMVSIFILLLWTPVAFLFKVLSWSYYVVAGILTPLLILYILLVRYEIEEGDLVCKTFLRKQRIKILSIISINKCRNAYVSFATALDRFEVRFGVPGGEKWSRIYISPKNADEFLKEVIERNPKIKLNETLDDSKKNKNKKKEEIEGETVNKTISESAFESKAENAKKTETVKEIKDSVKTNAGDFDAKEQIVKTSSKPKISTSSKPRSTVSKPKTLTKTTSEKGDTKKKTDKE